ncbi:MAG: hypothetical protein J6W28_04300, partial [Clostridia bacterium]|nr:hypothetical protein [Clostridia bacterium]
MEKKTTTETAAKRTQNAYSPLPGSKAKKAEEKKKPTRKFWPTLFPYMKPYAKNMIFGAFFS